MGSLAPAENQEREGVRGGLPFSRADSAPHGIAGQDGFARREMPGRFRKRDKGPIDEPPEDAVAEPRENVLLLQERASASPSASFLLDVSGRKVLDLRPGANDVRALAPGVYFVREQSASSSQHSGPAVHKVIVTR